MPPLVERDQVGKRESLADLISNVESDATPFSSQIPKRPRPVNNIHDWQLKKYKTVGHKGVLDNVDATNFTHNKRKRVHAVGQKAWDNPAISDFADEATVAGLRKGEMAEQIADSIIANKFIIEKRGLSNEECQVDDGNVPNETRGIFKWGSTTAQALYPVPDGYRPLAAQIHSTALDTFTEEAFLAMCRSSYKVRKGPHNLDGYVGVDLKALFTDWTVYTADKTSFTAVRTFNAALSRTIERKVDMLELDTGKVRLHLASHILTDAETGEDTDYTHRSGLFSHMDMLWLRFIRKPRVRKLEDKGAGPRAIVDQIFMYGCDNPGQLMEVITDSDS